MTGGFVHQPEHLLDTGRSVSSDGPGQEVAYQGVQRRVMPVGVGSAGRQDFLINSEGDVWHIHIVCVHTLCVKGRAGGDAPG